jgi:alkylglycerol monooxygenase
MDLSIVTGAVPIFIGLMLLELAVGRTRGMRLYRLNDTIANLGNGAGQQVFALVINVFFIGLYGLAVRDLALARLEVRGALGWVLLFLAVDFLYYWFHRASHRMNFLWAAHVVHHQSEEYNLAVALRQSWLQEAFSAFFYLPLALAGIPVEAMLVAVAANTIGQFWFHTRAIGRLGPLERFLNTPSHHRVHHGRNPKYLDRNYAGVLIVWDRIFGTFQEEEEEPVYGIVKPLESWSVLRANTHYWIDLAGLSRRATGWRAKLAVWVLPPERTGSPAPEVNAASVRKYDARGAQAYAFMLLLFALAALRLMMEERFSWSLPARVFLAGIVLWTLLDAGACLESRAWLKRAEAARWGAVAIAAGCWWWMR